MTLATGRSPVDLHLHSTCSDGSVAPGEVMALAGQLGLGVVSLTDHDTMEGLPEARAAAERLELRFIDGVEISTRHPRGREWHLLAYGADERQTELRAALESNCTARHRRVHEMVSVLRASGVDIEVESVYAAARGGSVGRPHVADALVQAGIVRDRKEAFDRWLADGKPAAVPKQCLTVKDAIEIVHAAGGVTVLAHPSRWLDPELLDEFVTWGLDGLEVFHPSHSDDDVRRLSIMAARSSLLRTGGSDNHGDAAGTRAMSARRVPGELGAELLQACLEARVSPLERSSA